MMTTKTLVGTPDPEPNQPTPMPVVVMTIGMSNWSYTWVQNSNAEWTRHWASW